jgi:hypothetical protein
MGQFVLPDSLVGTRQGYAVVSTGDPRITAAGPKDQDNDQRVRAGLFSACVLVQICGAAIRAASPPQTDRHYCSRVCSIRPLREPQAAGRNCARWSFRSITRCPPVCSVPVIRPGVLAQQEGWLCAGVVQRRRMASYWARRNARISGVSASGPSPRVTSSGRSKGPWVHACGWRLGARTSVQPSFSNASFPAGSEIDTKSELG